jgi:bla regulator protein BlaR1
MFLFPIRVHSRSFAATMRLLIVILSSLTAFAQTFDVVSIKPQPYTGKGGESVGIRVLGNTLSGEHISLNDLVMFAYNLRGIQLSGGPAWAERRELISSELYQVTAKVSADPPPSMDAFRRMLQPTLADRFKLQVHHVQKDFPVYNLTVAKGGPKLKLSEPESKYDLRVFSLKGYGIRIVATKVTVAQLIEYQLAGYTTRPIFDKTGLTAPYDFTLEFNSEKAPAGQENPDVPSLVTAVQDQLGLKLEPATAPFDTVVIDHAERPTEN